MIFRDSKSIFRQLKLDTIGRLRGRQRKGSRRLIAAALCAPMVLTACDPGRPVAGTIGFVQGFGGVVVADEPRAVLIARDVLTAGGTAADAAVALGFALTVTLPSSAGLAGGGVCLVHSRETATTETVEFYPGRTGFSSLNAKNPSAVPALPRGMFLLHSKYGVLRWERLLIQSENLARFGNQVSRALAKDLALVAGPLLQDPQTRQVFGDKSGRILKEGDFLVQEDLSAVIAGIRAQGPGDFYAGRTARALVDAYRQADGTLSIEDLRAFRPKFTPAMDVPIGNEVVHVPPPPSAGGVMAQMLSMMLQNKAYQGAPDAAKGHVLAEMAQRAFADRANWMNSNGTSKVDPKTLIAPERITAMVKDFNTRYHTSAPNRPLPIKEDPAGTGFVVMDRAGSAVACTLTMNKLFGQGRFAPGTGMLMAAAPDPAGRGPFALAPMLLVNHNTNEVWFAGTATGGAPAATSLVETFAKVHMDRRTLADAVGSTRIHSGSSAEMVFLEKGGGTLPKSNLEERGQKVLEVGGLGTVNAAYCDQGLPSHSDNCQRQPDTRGFGLGIIVGREF